VIAQFRCRRCGQAYEGWLPDPPYERGPGDPPEPHCPTCPPAEQTIADADVPFRFGHTRVFPRRF
jgi:hypothetical protein